jgi:hypothetical protein
VSLSQDEVDRIARAHADVDRALHQLHRDTAGREICWLCQRHLAPRGQR